MPLTLDEGLKTPQGPTDRYYVIIMTQLQKYPPESLMGGKECKAYVSLWLCWVLISMISMDARTATMNGVTKLLDKVLRPSLRFCK